MSNKIDLDKYYTPLDKAKYCIDKVYEIIGENNISEAIEPSAGNGSFSLQVPTTCLAYDIEPEHESITKQDFLTLNIDYLYGRLIIGNPPYGREIGKFVKKAYEESLKGATVVCLTPSRTDTSWWHNYAMKGEIQFIRGRLKFVNRTFPSWREDGNFKTCQRLGF